MDWKHIVVLFLGLVLAGWNTWQHLGRTSASRGWAYGTHRSFKPRSVLVIRPLMAVALVLIGVTGPAAGSDAATIVLGLLILPCLFVPIAFLVFPIPIPTFAQPRWYRRYCGHRG